MALNTLKNILSNNAKNMRGWSTNRKIVVFAVDDYGNVRMDSKQALENLTKAGMKSTSRFDMYDTLETESDLQMLYQTLTFVKDKNGRAAVFSAFALPANIDFEKIIAEGYEKYHYELLPVTFSKLKGYENVWTLWKEGMEQKILVPHSHGREHLNLKVFQEMLEAKDPQIIEALNNRSYAGIVYKKYPTISYTAAFDFHDFNENEVFKGIIEDGLNAFEKVFGFRTTHFNPPGGRENPVLHSTLKANGILYIDTPFDKKEHQGHGKYKKVINYMGKKNALDQTFLIRNAVFEPAEKRNFDWVTHTMKQIDIAFRWHKPAVISSHRVNYCGHIDENNRKKGISELKKLLDTIVKKYPDVEFMAASELGDLINSGKK